MSQVDSFSLFANVRIRCGRSETSSKGLIKDFTAVASVVRPGWAEIAPYAGEAKMVLEEGATIEQIDKAAVAFGARAKAGEHSERVLEAKA